MIHYLYGHELDKFPKLRDSMFKDRKHQFVDRLKWDLTVSAKQYEIDQYDRPDALYIICSDEKKRHRASMRLMPSNMATMINDHFQHIIPGIEFKSQHIWECTRFCSSPAAEPRAATSIISAATKLMFEQKLRAFLAVFDERVRRMYHRIGIPPIILGSIGYGSQKVGVGLWQLNIGIYQHLVASSLYSLEEYDAMYAKSSIMTNRSAMHKSYTEKLMTA